MTDTKVTAQMIRILKDLEGFKDVAYHDATGQSIGFGHFIKAGEEGLRGKNLSLDEANALLVKDIGGHQKAALAGLKVNISENQRAALTLLAYNAGPGAAQSVVRLLNKGDVKGAANRFEAFNKSRANKDAPLLVNPELVKRRAYEKELFLTADGQHFDESFDRYRKSKAPAIVAGTQPPSRAPSQSAVFDAAPDAALNENKRVLAELTKLRQAVGAGEASEDFENELRKEGSGV